MLQLGKTEFEERVLGTDQVFPQVRGLFEENGRRLVLQTCHLEGFHHNLIVSGSACRAVGVKGNHFSRSCRIWITGVVTLQLVLDRDLSACSKLLNELARGEGLILIADGSNANRGFLRSIDSSTGRIRQEWRGSYRIKYGLGSDLVIVL